MNLVKTVIVSAMAAMPIFAATAFQNQVGFMTKSQKQMAIVDAAGKDVVFKNANGTTVLTVKAPTAVAWSPAGDTAASLVDFSELQTAGKYQAYVGDQAVGHPINISDNALEDAAKASLKFFYFQRASTELTEEFAGKWARAAGHPDTSVKYHLSTGNDTTQFTSAPKGWYDAGDYGKYIVNSGISTYTLLQLYQQNKAYFDTLSLNIPESKNNVPDLLDEIRWNLEWMLKMQDTDGGVFHKLTTLKFAGTVMPEKGTAQRYMIGKGIEATWNFIAVMSLAAEIYKPFDENFSKSCIDAVEKGLKWAVANPYAAFEQPKDVKTGDYQGASAWASKFWATAEAYRVSQSDDVRNLLQTYKIKKKSASIQTWQDNYMLALFTIATNPSKFEQEMVDSAKSVIISFADDFLLNINNGYGLAINDRDFNWGSNGTISNKGMILIHAYILTGEKKYLNAAQGLVDYVLGRNPLDISYLTGIGVNSTKDPHHRPSQADNVDDPVPGMLAGGPNPTATDCAKSHIDPTAAAKAYYDNRCSFATNEVAINWNAPFAYVIGSLQAIAATGKAYDINSESSVKYELTSIPFARNNLRNKPVSENKRMVIRGNKVQLELTDRNGIKSHFSVSGKRIK